MAEQTLNTQLNGSEIIEAVVDRVRQTMKRDCYLNPNSAYDWFNAKVKIELKLHDTGSNIPTQFEVGIGEGKAPDPQEPVQTSEIETAIDAAAPNEVRVESGQPVPVLTKGDKGESVVKGVHYARGSAASARRG